MPLGWHLGVAPAALLVFFCGVTAQTVVGDSEITEDTRWTREGGPYVVMSPLTVQGGATLEIAAGTVVRFRRGAFLRVGWKTPGSLTVTGTSRRPVIFTADGDEPEPGAWAGIESLVEGSEVRLSWAVVEWAGAEAKGTAAARAALRIGPGSTADVQNCVVRQAAAHGVELDTERKVQFSGNRVHECRGAAVMTGANAAAYVAPDNRFEHNGLDAIVVGEVGLPALTRSAVWAHTASPYVIRGDLLVGDPDALVTLRLDPGVTVLFGPGAAMTVGWSYPADLVARGSDRAPIRFGALAGPWDGVYLGGTGPGTLLDHCVFSGGGAERAMLNVESNAHALVRDCAFRDSRGWGVFLWKGALARIEACTFSGNRKGDIGREELRAAQARL